MLRVILLASPVVLIALVSCGDSSASFDDITGGSAGSSNPLGGASNGGKSGQAGNSASAGSSSAAGGSSKGGQGSGKGGQGSGKGGTANNGGTKNTAGSANNGGTANQAGSASPGGAGGAGGAGGGGAPTDSGGAAGTGEAGAAGLGGGPTDPLCPDLFGTYRIKNKDGMCNGLNKDASQSIEGTAAACTAHFVSEPLNGPEGLNGAASIDADGNFTGVMLYLDMTERNPCSGNWNAQDETMTVTCGGQGDMCTVLLELQ